ncbi:MAG: CrcB family protein [Planctomycetota bacterium]|nr:CrcB family protein [Planctomycetota bacterium]
MQNHELILIAAVGGGLGAWTRMIVRDECVAQGIASWRVVLWINIVGSALAGMAMPLTSGSFEWALFALGFLGGFTTFSSMCVDIVVQWIVGRRRTAATIAIGTMIGGPLSAWISSFLTAKVDARSAISTVAIVPLAGRRFSHHASGLIGITLGGFIGTSVRVSLQFLAPTLAFPVWTATALVNVIGSGFAGFAFRWLCSLDADGVAIHSPSRRLRLERLLIFGFAGGLTTMSTLSIEIIEAMHDSPLNALLIASVNVVVGLSFTILGWWIAFRWFPMRESMGLIPISNKVK